MSKSEKHNPGYVTRMEFNRRFQKVDLALFGSDGRGGIVKDIGDIKGSIKVIEKSRKEEKQENRRFTGLIYSIIGGAIVAFFSWALAGL